MSADGGGSGGRSEQRDFWHGHSSRPDVTSMMLNERAASLADGDTADIVAALPAIAALDVVDIGAGIGRFTSAFVAGGARSVLAVDFVQSFLERNKATHAGADNVRFVLSDAVGLTLPPRSVDLVFTNWLMMYLSDVEMVAFLHNALAWLRPGGYLHIRESCSQPSTAHKRAAAGGGNPTFYRPKSHYLHLFAAVCAADAGGGGACHKFDTLWAKSVETYVAVEGNWRQIHMLLRKAACGCGRPPPDAQALVDVTLTQDALAMQKAAQTKYDASIRGSDVEERTAAVVECCRSVAGDGAIVIVHGDCAERRLDPIRIAKQCGARVLCVERDAFLYRSLVAHMNERKETNARAIYLPSPSKTCKSSPLAQLTASVIVTHDLISWHGDDIAALLALFKQDAKQMVHIVSLERDESDAKERLRTKFTEPGLNGRKWLIDGPFPVASACAMFSLH